MLANFRRGPKSFPPFPSAIGTRPTRDDTATALSDDTRECSPSACAWSPPSLTDRRAPFGAASPHNGLVSARSFASRAYSADARAPGTTPSSTDIDSAASTASAPSHEGEAPSRAAGESVDSPGPPFDPSLPVEYEGPWGTTATRVKRLSLFAAAFTFLTAPLLVFPPAALMVNHAPFAWKVAILGTMYSFTCFTTALLHWYVKPYVHRMKYDPATGKVQVEMADFITRKRWREFHISEAEYADSLHPYAQFKVRGKYYQLERPGVTHPEIIRQLMEIPRPGAELLKDHLGQGMTSGGPQSQAQGEGATKSSS